eukprot:6487396-Amphidinium_carterae.1
MPLCWKHLEFLTWCACLAELTVVRSFAVLGAQVWASLGAPLVLGCVVCIGACFGSTALASASALGGRG